MRGEHWKNGEGYYDPTPAKAIEEMEKKPKRRTTARDKIVSNVIDSIKSMLKVFDLELIGRVKLRDKKTGKEYL